MNYSFFRQPDAKALPEKTTIDDRQFRLRELKELPTFTKTENPVQHLVLVADDQWLAEKLSSWYQNEDFQLYQQPVTTTVFNFQTAEASDREIIAKRFAANFWQQMLMRAFSQKIFLKMRQKPLLVVFSS